MGPAHRRVRGPNFGRYLAVMTRVPFAAGLVALAALLGACSAADSLNPAGWFSSSGSDKKVSEESDTDEPAPASTPDWDELREKLADGLIADRENSSHTGRPIPRQSEQLAAPPGASTGDSG